MIAYNLQPLASDKLTGIGYYSLNVMKALMDLRNEPSEAHVFDFLGRNSAEKLLENHFGNSINYFDIHKVKDMPLGAYIRMGNLGKLRSYEILTHSKADLSVFFNYLTPAGLKGKRIITIYDMVCERYPETMDDTNRKLLQKHLRPSAERADGIITISEFSKNEIIELLNIPEDRIYVAPCGVDTNFYYIDEDVNSNREEARRIAGSENYILYVGTLEPRKNVKTLVKAFEKIADAIPGTNLVLAGGVGWHAEEMLDLIDKSPVKDRIIRTGYISNEAKRSLLRCAKVMVFPSMYEGFGMPVTEAMACGTPCIVADTSSLPEVSGGLNTICEYTDVNSFADAMLAFSRDEVSCDKYQLANYVKKYTWENAAQVVNEAISAILQ